MPNVAGGVTEYFDPVGDRQTYTASAAITGGQLVALTANRQVGPAAAGSVTVIGVALHDAANAEKVTVAHQGVWPIKAAGAITAGSRVIAGAAGTVAAAGAAADPRTIVGIAEEAIADTVAGRVKVTL